MPRAYSPPESKPRCQLTKKIHRSRHHHGALASSYKSVISRIRRIFTQRHAPTYQQSLNIGGRDIVVARRTKEIRINIGWITRLTMGISLRRTTLSSNGGTTTMTSYCSRPARVGSITACTWKLSVLVVSTININESYEMTQRWSGDSVAMWSAGHPSPWEWKKNDSWISKWNDSRNDLKMVINFAIKRCFHWEVLSDGHRLLDVRVCNVMPYFLTRH